MDHLPFILSSILRYVGLLLYFTAVEVFTDVYFSKPMQLLHINFF